MCIDIDMCMDMCMDMGVMGRGMRTGIDSISIAPSCSNTPCMSTCV